MGSSPPKAFDVRKIAIIGAGPCGIATAKYLRAQARFDSITLYEQQSDVGGIWNYSSLAPPYCPAPQQDPFYPPDGPVTKPGNEAGEAPIFPSPMYEDLHANIPKALMRFSDQKFSDDARLFPSREVIQEYLARYAESERSIVKFSFQVTNVSLRSDAGKDIWDLEARSVLDGTVVVRDSYDAVVVANGHYSIPFIPDMKNIELFNQTHSSVITHSKNFRVASSFADKKTLVVGNGPSGLDIALQINKASRHQTLLSVRSKTPPGKLEHTGCEEIPEIEEFLVAERGVRFADGRVETGLDAIVFCTGFLFSYPFLPGLQQKLITSGFGVHGLYKHLFCIDHPTLAFPALNMKATPWPLSEAQAAVLATVWSNCQTLPPTEEMRGWTSELEEKQGEALHVFRTQLSDGLYINELHDWATGASHLGKVPPYWDDKLLWQRSIFAEAKLRFEQQGCVAKTMDELGFQYDADWRSK